MPGRDGTGPVGDGRGGRFNQEASGNCLCPKCGEKVPHRAGFPCTTVKCPKCQTAMIHD